MLIKTIRDYEDELCKKFPQVCKTDIQKILKFGWKQLYLCNSYGGDVIMSNGKDFYFYTGIGLNDPCKHFFYYLKKTAIKAMVMYKRKKIKWDGYYYFACTNPQQEQIEKQKLRDCKNINYGNHIFYKNYDECRIKEWNRRYIYRINWGIDFGRILYRPEFCSQDVEFYEYRPSIKFDSIFTSNKGNYKYI